MSTNNFNVFWNRIIIPFAAIGIVILTIIFFMRFFKEEGVDKGVRTLVLLLAALIGFLHLVLFMIVKLLGPDKANPKTNKRARNLNQFRKTINYITPFALIAILYHFLKNDWFLASIIVAILLLDRINDLTRKEH